MRILPVLAVLLVAGTANAQSHIVVDDTVGCVTPKLRESYGRALLSFDEALQKSMLSNGSCFRVPAEIHVSIVSESRFRPLVQIRLYMLGGDLDLWVLDTAVKSRVAKD